MILISLGNNAACSFQHKHFLLNVSTEYEPVFYHQVAPFPLWQKAMKDEIDAMEHTRTWTVVPLPSSHHAIGSKWVYCVKFKLDGRVDRYKAQLVAKGYSTFSPFAKIVTIKVTIKVLLTLVTTYQ